MDLSKVIFTAFYFVPVFLFTFAYSNHAEGQSHGSGNPAKSLIVQEIMKKVGALSKTSHENQELILKKIESKLRKSAKAIGPDAEKYIRFIMKEFKAKMKALATVKEPENNQATVQHTLEVKKKKLVRRTKPIEGKKIPGTLDPETKKIIIKDIANKIQNLANEFIQNAKTIESKEKILEKIKSKVIDSTVQKHIQLHNRHTELKTYSSLIAKGLEVSMRRMLGNKQVSGRRNADIQVTTVSEDITLEEDKPVNYKKVEEDILKKTMNVMDLEEINKYKELILKSVNGTSVDPRCDTIVLETCKNVKSITQIPCGVGKTTPIENLCNNVVDCLNGVDEMNCAAQAMEQVRKATTVISEIEESINLNCITLTEQRLLKSRNQILQDVLHTQIKFLEKHVKKPTNGTATRENSPIDPTFVKTTVNDVNKILSTLSYALNGALCALNNDSKDQNLDELRKINDNGTQIISEIPQNTSWAPNSCHCKGQFCKESTCDASCKLVCSQRYSLSRWKCKPLNGTTSVSLDEVCDGKLDCFDESDESSCVIDGTAVTSKFKAVKLYSDLIDLLAMKSKSNEFVKNRHKFITLQRLVRQLQQKTTRTNIDNHTIKSLREEFFTELVSIFDDLLNTGGLYEIGVHYQALQEINKHMIEALKASHTGNENLISSEGCFCRGGLCALRRCNKHCIQACLAEPLLTKFPCNDNISISTELVCNGIINCPNEEDEKDCLNDICRGHHLVMLRHNLENVGAKHRGTVMGEMIESWRAKVSAILVVQETSKTNHRTLVEIVNRLLHDLVMTFAAMEDYRRSNSEYALREFKGISKIVMQAIKSCAN